MAEEALAKAGLHFDELNKIRVLEPEVAQQTGELKEECKDFLDSKLSRNVTEIECHSETETMSQTVAVTPC